jgi:hypothetical protein
MQIRVMGLPVEVDAAVAALRGCEQLALVQVDGPYLNRGDSTQVRLYVRALCRAAGAQPAGGGSEG